MGILSKFKKIFSEQNIKEKADSPKPEEKKAKTSSDELDPAEAREKRRRARRKRCIDKTVEKTGWTREKAAEEISFARKNCGIKYKEYIKFKFYDVPREEQKEVYKALKKKERQKEIRENKRDGYINDIAKEAGWSYEYAKEQINKTRKRLGCTYKEYAYMAYHLRTEEEQDALHALHEQSLVEKRERIAEKKELGIAKTQEYLGCSREEAEAFYKDAKERTGFGPSEYVDYEFWKLDKETQDSLFLQRHGNRIRNVLNCDVRWYRIFMRKHLTNQYFGKYTRRKWCINTSTSYEDFCKTFEGISKIFYKPNSLMGGKGARPFELIADNYREVYEELQQLPEGVVEEYVVQHHRMNEMSPTAVNTIRIVTLYSDKPLDEEGNTFKLAYAMLKMGGETGCVDNLHGGGLGAAIDPATGTLCTDAVDDNGRHSFAKHPVTGTTIKGFEVPYFKEAVEMVKEIITENDIHGYLAWDVAITEDGPMLIEINGNPGATLLDLPYFGTTGKGRKEYMKNLVKYFCEIE